jgi:hypothetical protein
MQISSNSNIDGFKAAEASLAARGDRIAKATTQAVQQVSDPAADAKPAQKSPDITSDIVGLNTDRLAGAYNLKAQKVKNDMLGDVLDILK